MSILQPPKSQKHVSPQPRDVEIAWQNELKSKSAAIYLENAMARMGTRARDQGHGGRVERNSWRFT